MPDYDKINADLSIIPPGEALIIAPPMAMLKTPSLAAHLLQACARAAGFQVSVLYANMMFAATLGVDNYDTVLATQANALLGERLFAASAYGLPPLGYNPEQMMDIILMFDQPAEAVHPRLRQLMTLPLPAELPMLEAWEAITRRWVDDTAQAIVGCNFKVIGCTSSFQQTAAGVALLKKIKSLRPDVVTIMGGANCEGEMAEGIASLSPAIDYIFAGESEHSYPDFLSRVLTGHRPPARIITGEPYTDLNDLPTPDFTNFYTQLAHYLPVQATQKADIRLPYETSRGCWWGQKHHCTFCGVNGQRLTFREKSPDRIIGELKQLLAVHPTRRVDTTDSIMPFTFFKTLIPRLAAEVGPVGMLYDQKSNLTLTQVMALKQAGVNRIVPGIEALSTPLLRRMDKGVLARQNIALLRYTRAVKLQTHWILLWGLPGDQQADYEQTLALMPLLHHLEPPVWMNFIHIARFSPYFMQPDEYGLRHLRPWGCYKQVLPPGADLAKVAYYFIAEYDADSCRYPDLIFEVKREMEAWQAAWNFTMPMSGQYLSFRPRLEVIRHAADQFELRDTRGLPDTEVSYALNRQQAATALVGGPLRRAKGIEWALAHKVGVELDGWYVPLATAKPELLQEFEQE
ncbi:MAG: RiPP maturation radical SAM C-methyltransferase [Anaerolineae bacterium]|nr:RiPP maturation radical SAM C-methyltransferase [Anaerolineae bacterium]